MSWNLDYERPIYAQLIEHVQLDIITGHYQPGERLPSVRDLAAEASVNPNMMQRALAELENSGLVRSQRTNGRFVTEDTGLIQSICRELARTRILDFIKTMRQLNLSDERILELIQTTMKEDTQ